MATEKGTKSADDKARQKTDTKYPIEKLAENCRQLFGVSSCTFAGAAHGMTGEYTVEEMRARLKRWRKKEVR